MERVVKVAVLANEVEASLLDSILTERQIPHIVRSYHDAVYDGLFQVQKGWGCVEAAEADKAEIEQILADLRENTALDEHGLTP